MARAKVCGPCSPAKARQLAERTHKLARAIEQCSKGSKRSKASKRARASSGLAALTATVREHSQFFAQQRRTNAAVRDTFAAIYAVTTPRQVFTVRDARTVKRQLGAPARGIPARALAQGMTAELEHGRRAGRLDVTHDDPLASARIALAHMRENRAYYPELARFEHAVEVRQLPAPAAAAKAPRRRGKRGRVDVAAVESVVEQLEADPLAIPQPIGPSGYRPPQCAVDHDPWGGEYAEMVGEATERASIEAGDDEDAFRRALRANVEQLPQFAHWRDVERECVADFRRKHPRKGRRTVTSSMETAAAIEEASREAGYDVRGSAEHLDRLTLRGQAAYWRRVYKRTNSVDALRRAREIEARDRARKKKGAGVKSFAVG